MKFITMGEKLPEELNKSTIGNSFHCNGYSLMSIQNYFNCWTQQTILRTFLQKILQKAISNNNNVKCVVSRMV